MATPLRNIRIDDTLWAAAQKVAAGRDENLSEIIREALADYVKKNGAKK